MPFLVLATTAGTLLNRTGGVGIFVLFIMLEEKLSVFDP